MLLTFETPVSKNLLYSTAGIEKEAAIQIAQGNHEALDTVLERCYKVRKDRLVKILEGTIMDDVYNYSAVKKLVSGSYREKISDQQALLLMRCAGISLLCEALEEAIEAAKAEEAEELEED